MKRIICLCFTLFVWQLSHAQIAFFDADRIKAIGGVAMDPKGFVMLPENPNLYQLLKPYSRGGNTEAAIKDAFANNPFMHFADGGSHDHDAIADAQRVVAANVPFTSGLGALPVTNIVNGIAQFMIKRAKEELTITFFNKFQEFTKQHQEFIILFPKTVDVLGNLLTYQYPTMLSHLQDAFLDDLSNLYAHLPTFLALPQYQAFFDKFPEIKVAIGSLALVQRFAFTETTPAEILLQFGDVANPGGNVSQGLKDFGNAVNLAVIFSESVRQDAASADHRSWISLPTFLGKANNELFLQIYVGLIYQKIVEKDIQFGETPIHFANEFAKLNNPKGPLALMRAEMTQFLALAQKTDSLVKDINAKKAAGTKVTNDDIFTYINTSIDVVEFGFDIARFFNASVDVHPYTQLARDGNSIYRNIYQKQYPEAVTNTLDFVEELFKLIKSNKLVETDILTSVKATVTRLGLKNISASSLDDLGKDDYKEIETAINNNGLNDDQRKALHAAVQYKSFVKLQKVLDVIKNYGLFVANLASAKSADDVESIVENAALPVGSSSIKKYSEWNISVQSYLGASYRFDNAPSSQTAWNNRLNVFGPIGISINRGLGKGGSIGAMFTLLDLGAIIDYQLRKDSVVNDNGSNTAAIKKDYEIRLGQIFSPGFHVVYGFWGNLPLAAGVGLQYGPGLGKIDNGGNLLLNNPNLRFNAFLAVDIPFFTLFNKKFKTN